jgi:hypothetical protein
MPVNNSVAIPRTIRVGRAASTSSPTPGKDSKVRTSMAPKKAVSKSNEDNSEGGSMSDPPI